MLGAFSIAGGTGFFDEPLLAKDMMQRMPVMMDRAVIFFIIFFLTPTLRVS